MSKIVTDADGKWEVFPDGIRVMLEPSETFISEKEAAPSTPKDEQNFDLAELVETNKLLKAQNNALSEQNAMLEDCIVEMAQFVYA